MGGLGRVAAGGSWKVRWRGGVKGRSRGASRGVVSPRTLKRALQLSCPRLLRDTSERAHLALLCDSVLWQKWLISLTPALFPSPFFLCTFTIPLSVSHIFTFKSFKVALLLKVKAVTLAARGALTLLKISFVLFVHRSSNSTGFALQKLALCFPCQLQTICRS